MVVFLFAACLLPFISAGSEDQSSTATVQRLFDAMSTHDADAARALFIPQASLFSVQPDGTAVAVPYEKWLEHLSASKDSWLERIWNPKVLEHESVAIVWAQYDFHLNGKFSHCGIDSFNLLKTAAGWKIAAVADTHEVSGCSPSPLGPPAK
ncbi:MAG: DUF4440 domain-containing protein [Acidobacteriaceae bacterium]|nr:DUF4440 domain-containing protein [Acidobacteriaceae bacterium]